MNRILISLLLLSFLRFSVIKAKSAKDSQDHKPKLLDEILGGVDNLWQKQVSNIQRYEDCKRNFNTLKDGVGSCFKVLVGGLTPEEQQYVTQQEQQAQVGNQGQNNGYNNYPSYLAQQQQLLNNGQQQGLWNNPGQYGQTNQNYGNQNQGYWTQNPGQGQNYGGQQGYLNPQIGQGGYGGQGQQGYLNPQQQGQGYYGQNVEQQGYQNPQQQGQGYYGQNAGQFNNYGVKQPQEQNLYTSIPQAYLFNVPVGTNNGYGYGNMGMQQQPIQSNGQQFVSPGAIVGFQQQPGYFPQQMQQAYV